MATGPTYPDDQPPGDLGTPPVVDVSGLLPDGYFPGDYLPGVWSGVGPRIGGLRDQQAFEAIARLFGRNGVKFAAVTYGGPYDTERLPRGRGPFLHLRRLRYDNRPDDNPTLLVRRVEFEAIVTWRAAARERSEAQVNLVAGIAEAALTGNPLGFCVPQETMIRSARVVDAAWPLVRMVMTGQFVYEWDTLYGAGPPPFEPPLAVADTAFDPERLRLRLLQYLRACQRLAPWHATIRGWEGEPYPWWPPRHDQLPYLRLSPPHGRAAWKYENAFELTVQYELTLAVAYPDASAFTNFFGAVFRAFFPAAGDPDRRGRTECFRSIDVEGMGVGEMVQQPTEPKRLGYDPYGLIGTARVEFRVNAPAG